jgi:hypothetical protein
MTKKSGPGRVHASRSALREGKKPKRTYGISGRRGSVSSISIALQSFLASRLQALMASGGSILFRLTWKEQATPSGRRICALQASVLRTFAKGSTSSPSIHPWSKVGWPSPISNDATGSAYSYRNGNHREKCLKLPGVAQLVGWPTPCAQDGPKGGLSQGTDRLPGAVQLASWATPAAREAGGTPEQFLERNRKAQRAGKQLGVSLTSLALQAQLTASGGSVSGSHAKTENSARLNPAHSRWLLGYPAAWDDCAPTVTRSFRK